MRYIWILLFLFLVGCGEDEVKPTGKTATYTIEPYGASSVSAIATLTELSNGYTRVELVLSGTDASKNYLAHIHFGNISKFGFIATHLGNSDDKNISIRQEVTNTVYSYDDWISFDGYIAIHIDDDDKYPIVSVGNIGANVD